MPFTYYLYHNPTRKHYYGARWAKNCGPDTLWNSYFSSCRDIHELIKQYGVDSFNVRVMRVFNTGEEARMWEHKFIKRVKAVESDEWINRSNGQPPVCNYSRAGQGAGRKLSYFHRKAISNGNKGKLRGAKQNPDHIASRAKALTGRTQTEETKRLIGNTNKANQPLYTFTNIDGTSFVGRTNEWSEEYNLNIKSASTVFCAGRTYKGWTRVT